MNEPEEFECFALIELFGHQRIAGRVTEQTIGGTAFLRVDVPACGDKPGFTKFFGSGSIYAMTPCVEEIALAAANRYGIEPVTAYDIPELRALRNQRSLPMGGGGLTNCDMHDDESY